jgi:transcriptional regulator with XRE-family HTH domain
MRTAVSRQETNDVGARLKDLRTRGRLSLRQLGDRCGVTASYLSNLERGRSSPTLVTLSRVLHALGSDLESFFTDATTPHSTGPVFRRSDMRSAADVRRHYTFCLPRQESIKIQMLDEYLAPGEDEPEFEALDCDVAGFLLSGTVEFQIDGEAPVIMRPGDVFYVPENTSHWGRCLGQEPAHLITVFVPPRY